MKKYIYILIICCFTITANAQICSVSNLTSTSVTINSTETGSLGLSFGLSASNLSGSISFSGSTNLSSLQPNTTYFYRVTKVVAVGIPASFQTVVVCADSFTTLTDKPPVISTNATIITNNSAVIGGEVLTKVGLPSVTERGVVYSNTNTSPEINIANVTKDTNGTGIGIFSETISNLLSGATYYYRAYAINSAGIGYGSIKSFTTTGVSLASIERQSPTRQDLFTNTATFKVTFTKPVKNVNITDFTSNSNGTTISNVNAISTSAYEVTLNNITTNGDVFLQLKGVNGVAGSNDISSLAVSSIPNITVNQIVNNDYFNQTKIGQTYTSGITGVLKKITLYPEIGQHNLTGTVTADLKIYTGDETDGGVELYSENITITNSTAATGQEFTLATPQSVIQGNTYSVVLTNFSSSGYAFSASKNTDEYAGGHIIFTGFNANSHSNIDLKIKIEEETIPIIGDITLASTTSATIEKFVKLAPNLPVIITTDVTNVSISSANLGGEIIFSGTSAITERGIVYANANSYPKINAPNVTKAVSAETSAIFSDIISNLTTSNTIFYRAYATNSSGTSYGAVKRFSLNNALHFNGSNDIVTISDNANLNFFNGFSFDALIKPDNFSSTRAIASKYSSGNREIALLIKNDGTVEYTISNNGSSENYFTTTTALTANVWQHIAFTYHTDGTMKCYINGTDAGATGASGSPTGVIYNGTADFELGSRDGGLDFQGALDEVRIWNKALSSTLINQIKNKVVPADAAGLVAYYQFNQGITAGDNSSITTLIDKTSNALNGTLDSFNLLNTTSNFVAGASGDFNNNRVAKNSFMATGNWSDTTKWSFGKVPTNIEAAFIDENQTITIDVDDLEIDDFELANNATLNIPVNKEITVNNSFETNGNLTLSSDKTNSSVLLINGTSTGNITYSRGGLVGGDWSIVTPPVAGQTIKTFAEDNANDIRENTTVTPIRYAIATYDDAQTIGSKWVYYDANVNATDEFVAGQSYSMSRATDGSVSFTGTLNVEDLNKTLIADAWNAIGNPFTTYFPANKNSSSSFLSDNMSKLDVNFPSLYIWDATQNKYVAVTELDATARSLPPGQGFFIRMKTGETSVNFNKEKRSTKPLTGTTDFARTEATPDITLTISKDDIAVNTSIKFFSNATTGFDAGYDIGNFGSSTLDIYSHLADNSNANNYTIQSLSNSNFDDVVIPISINAKKGDNIILSGVFTNIPRDIKVYLEDRNANSFTELTATSHKEIVIENDGATKDRFFIHLSQKALSANTTLLTDVALYSNQKTLFIHNVKENGTIVLHSLLGKKVYQQKVNVNAKTEIPLQNLAKGIYLATVKTNSGTITKKIVLE